MEGHSEVLIGTRLVPGNARNAAMELLGHVEEGNLVCVYNIYICICICEQTQSVSVCVCDSVIIIYQTYTLAIIYQAKIETADTLES